MRCIKLTGLFALPLAFALMLGAAPQPAEAGLCKKEGFNNGCVTGKDVKNDNLKAKDLKDEPGAAFDGGEQVFPLLLNVDQTVRTVTLVAPRDGVVIVTASGDIRFTGATQAAACSITTGSALDTTAQFRGENESLISFVPFSSTRAFVVPAGSFTVNLVCRSILDLPRIEDSNLVALYVATMY